MPSDLSGLEVERVSLLVQPKRPANRLKIAVAKAQHPDGGDMSAPNTEKLELAATPELAAVLRTAAEAGEGEAGLEGELRGFNSAHRNAILAMRRIFGRVKPEMAKELLSKLPKLLGIELPEAAPAPAPDAGGGAQAPAAAPIAASIDGIPLEPVVKADGALDLSGVPSAKRAAAEALWKQALRLRELERKDRLAVHVAKAQSMPRVGAAQEVGALLMCAAERMPAAEFDKLLALLKQADALIAQGGFAESGSGRGSEPAADDPLVRAKQAAAKIAKDSGGKVTEADALGQVFADQPSLYQEYLTAQRRRAAAGA